MIRSQARRAPDDGSSPALPATLLSQLGDVGVSADELEEPTRGGAPRPVRHLVGRDVVVDVAVDARGQRLNRLEDFGRAWARRNGVAVPDLLSSDPDGRWLIGRRVATSEPRGRDYLASALEQARVIAGAPLPQGRPEMTTWRAPRRTRPARTARLVSRTGALALTLVRVRRAVEALPRAETAHGDFYFRNVLANGAGGSVLVVDWEHLGSAPPGSDALRLWSTTKDPAERDWVLDQVMSGLDRTARAQASLLAYWLSLRLVAENLSSPSREHRRADADHALAVLPEARCLARRWGGW